MKRVWIAAILLGIASVLLTGALAVSASDPFYTGNPDVSASDPFYAGDLADFREIRFTPPANSAYGVYVFSEDGNDVNARVEIADGEEIVCAGEGRGEVCSAWLVSGTEYAVRVSGYGSAAVEIARQALSRCAENPLPIQENETRRKSIVRGGDAHWHAFTAEKAGLLMMTCVPEDAELSLGACLFDASGSRIAEFERLPGGACMLRAQTESDCDYAVRVWAVNGETGGYALSLHREESARILPVPKFDEDAATVSMNGARDLTQIFSGEALLWVSEDPGIAAVDQSGVVTGLREGECRITAYGLSAVASCRVEVRYVPLEALAAATDEITLAEGDEADVQLILSPRNTSDRSLRFFADDPEVAEISPNGVVKGICAGETTVRVQSLDSGLECAVRVRVTAAARRYRALIVAEENYPHTAGASRTGSRASAEAIAAMLGTMEYDSAAFTVRRRADLSKAELIAEIRSAFAGASEKDVSLFYINCHGTYRGGMSFFELSDGSSMAARDLEAELRRIPGVTVVMLDCCGSGGAIGEGSEWASGYANPAFASDRYKVFCSAGLDEDSFRVAFGENGQTGAMATAFARALCDGAGWDIDRDTRGSMGADADYDGRVTVNELQMYLEERVNWYMELASSLSGTRCRQTVRFSPKGDPMVLFERKSK